MEKNLQKKESSKWFKTQVKISHNKFISLLSPNDNLFMINNNDIFNRLILHTKKKNCLQSAVIYYV